MSAALSAAGIRRRPRRRRAAAAGVFLVLLASLVAGAVTGRSDEPAAPAASVYGRTGRAGGDGEPGPGQGTAPDGSTQAERIVAGGLGTLGRAGSFSCRLRHKARIGDRVLVGTGRYLQSGRSDEQRFRFESTLECDSESFESLEVCDGLFCWSYQREGSETETLRRFDVRRVRERIASLDPAARANPAPYLGGLQRSLASLRQNFRFERVDAGDLDGTDVWVAEGRWDPARLASVLPAEVEAAGGSSTVLPRHLPDGVPWSVRVAVGRSDLLVRRVEWLGIPGPRPVGDAPVEPIAVLDLFDVQLDGPVDATAFFYQPVAAGLIDFTEEYAKRLEPLRP